MKNAIRVNNIIKQIGETILTFDDFTGEYLINDENPFIFPDDYYSKLFKDFKTYLALQLKENATDELINIYLNSVKAGMKEFSDNLDNNSTIYESQKESTLDKDKYSDKYSKMLSIFSVQNSVLNQVKSILNDELEFVNFGIKSDYSDVNFNLLNNDIPKENTGKATFKLGKKEALVFFFVLEQENLIQFENDIQRRKFIETNFNYTEMRENASNFGFICEMSGTGKEFSNFNSYIEAKSNNKTLERLLKRLNETIHLFEFKS